MEGMNVYDKSYKEVDKLIKSNTTGSITIDYSKLDERTAAELRTVIRNTLQERKRELWSVLSGVD